MEKWRFKFTDKGENDLRKLDSAVRSRIVSKLKWFRDNFHLVVHEPLGGAWDGYFKNSYNSQDWIARPGV